MNPEKDRKNRTRRKVLKLLGTTGSASIFSAGAAAAAGSNSGNGQTFRPETAGLDTVDEAVVNISEKGVIRIRMGGTIEPGTPARGYNVDFHDLRDKKGDVRPDRAQVVAKQIPVDGLSGQAEAHVKKTPDDQVEERTVTSEESKQGTDRAGDGLPVMSGGGDNQSDYEGGCWVRSEDPGDLDLCMTKFWMVWDRSGGDVGWNDWRYNAKGFDTPAQTYWNLRNAWFGNSNFDGDDVTADMGANYRNWNWRADSKNTDAHHRLNLSGDPDGSLTWWTNQWHTGQDSHLLRTDTGHYTYGQV